MILCISDAVRDVKLRANLETCPAVGPGAAERRRVQGGLPFQGRVTVSHPRLSQVNHRLTRHRQTEAEIQPADLTLLKNRRGSL